MPVFLPKAGMMGNGGKIDEERKYELLLLKFL